MRLRVSIRVLMVVVAIAALCVGPVFKYVQTLRKRSRDYAETANTSIKMIGYLTLSVQKPYLTDEERQSRQRLLVWYQRRIGAYTRAASRPWIVVVDEPRPPIVTSKPAPTPPTWEPPPLPEPPKPLATMTEAEKNAYRLSIVEHVKNLGTTLQGEMKEKTRRYSARPLQSPMNTGK